MDIQLIFQLAGLGVIIAFVHTILTQLGKSDYANWLAILGFLFILYTVLEKLSGLFDELRKIFMF